MPEGRPAFVHDLGLALRVKILSDFAHDSYDLALPRLQQRSVFFDEVQNVFLRFIREASVVFFAELVCAFGNGAPQIVDLFLQVLFAVFLPAAFFLGRNRIRPFVAIDPVIHQRMAGVEQVFNSINAVAFFALHDVLLGEHQVVDDRAGVGPGAKQVIALEEAVVAVAGVRDHQRLHADGVFFHQISDARV